MARTEKKKNAFRISVGKPKINKEINRLKDLGQCGTISKWIAKKKKKTGECRLDYSGCSMSGGMFNAI
jgi:hypothetical protein